MIHPRKTLAAATGLTGLAALGGRYLGGADTATGVLVGGAVAVLDFWLLARNVGAQADLLVPGSQPHPRLWYGVTLFRLAAVLGLLWFGLRLFPPAAILAGLASVVVAISLRAGAFLVLQALAPSSPAPADGASLEP